MSERAEVLAKVVNRALHTGVCGSVEDVCCWGDPEEEAMDCASNPLTRLAAHVAAALDAALAAQEDEPSLDARFDAAVRKASAQHNHPDPDYCNPRCPRYTPQEGERGGADVAAAVDAVLTNPAFVYDTPDGPRFRPGTAPAHVAAALADAAALRQHDAEVLRAAADDLPPDVALISPFMGDLTAAWLRDRADRIAGDQS